MLGSNYTFLVNVHYEGRDLQAVYKPLRGEQPLWDFPDNTLAQREVAAYLVSEALGFHFVPYTTLREDGPFYGPGSLQQYIEYDPEYHYFNFSDEDKLRLPPVVLFDLLVNNADRKGSHVLIEKGTNIYLSEDFAFCQRWRALGGKIWLDTKSRLTHTGVYSYEGSPEMSLVAGTASV